MDPVIIGSIITAAGAIIAAVIIVVIQGQKAKRQEDIGRRAIQVLQERQPDKLDVIGEFDKFSIDFNKDWTCSILRSIKLVPTEGATPLLDKKILLIYDSIDPYLYKTGKKIDDIKPDKEFGIIAIDERNKVRLGSSTAFTHNNTWLTTNILFDNPVTHDNPIELKVRYSHLDTFFWQKLWQEHTDEWFIRPNNPIQEYELEILFPKTLPTWFRPTKIGTALIPDSWAEVQEDTKHGRRRLFLSASNLQPSEDYRLKIDVERET